MALWVAMVSGSNTLVRLNYWMDSNANPQIHGSQRTKPNDFDGPLDAMAPTFCSTVHGSQTTHLLTLIPNFSARTTIRVFIFGLVTYLLDEFP